jgi:recombinational DNA repair ATPase RecF
MKIIKLILRDYNLLFLNNIREIIFTPIKKTNLILGTNGSGKSSLLKELSPLVFDKKHFGENGYKEVHIEHNNKMYILTQEGNKCSFKENGVELNASANRKVQSTLVKEKLKYDIDYHKLFLGITNFTTMSPSERKEWLIRLSNVNYDYSLGYFKRLLSRDRDIRGTIKILNSIRKNEKDTYSRRRTQNHHDLRIHLPKSRL